MKKEYVITLILVACVLGCLFYSSIRNLQAIGFEPGPNIAALKCATSIYCSDDVWIGIDSDEGRIVFDNQATDEVNIMSANVGIGTATPGTLLQLETDGNAYLTLKNATAENTDGAAETKIIFEDHANAALAQIQASHDGTSDDTKGDLILSTHTGSDLTEALRIDSAQNIGMGDSDPGTALQISRTTPDLTLKNTTDEHTDAGADSNIFFEDHSNTALAKIQGAHDGASDDTKGDLIFYTHSGSSLREVMRMDSSRNIGIGTQTPAARMHFQLSTDGSTYVGDETVIYESGTTLSIGYKADDAQLIKLSYGSESDADACQIRTTYNSGDPYYCIYTSGTERWRLDATGIQTSNGLTIRNYSAALADEAEITVATGTAGFGFVQIGDNQEYAQFTWTAAGVVSLVYNTANVLSTDTDANLCIYDAGTGIAIKNRLGSELTVRFVLNYS